jgi:hypothetical protein
MNWLTIPLNKRNDFLKTFPTLFPSKTITRQPTHRTKPEHGDQLVLQVGAAKYPILRVGKKGKIDPEGPFDPDPRKKLRGDGFLDGDTDVLKGICNYLKDTL